MVESFIVKIGDENISIKAPKLELDSNIKELGEYLGVSFDVLKKELEKKSERYGGFGKYVKVSEEEWNSRKINQNKAKEIMKFYSETENYMPELMIVSASEDKQKLRRFIAAYCKKEGVKKILDFGCGVGDDCIIAALNGLSADGVDIESKTFDFAKWRFNKYGVNVNTFNINEEFFNEKYDAINCIEVLQHLPDVEKTLEQFYENLNENGLLFLAFRFKGNYTLALKKNEKYENNFDGVVRKKGFELIDKVHMWGPKDSSGKWLYVFKKN